MSMCVRGMSTRAFGGHARCRTSRTMRLTHPCRREACRRRLRPGRRLAGRTSIACTGRAGSGPCCASPGRSPRMTLRWCRPRCGASTPAGRCRSRTPDSRSVGSAPRRGALDSSSCTPPPCHRQGILMRTPCPQQCSTPVIAGRHHQWDWRCRHRNCMSCRRRGYSGSCGARACTTSRTIQT